MICYRDKTFCASETKNHTCGRKLTREEREHAERINLPIAYAYFCENDK